MTDRLEIIRVKINNKEQLSRTEVAVLENALWWAEQRIRDLERELAAYRVTDSVKEKR